MSSWLWKLCLSKVVVCEIWLFDSHSAWFRLDYKSYPNTDWILCINGLEGLQKRVCVRIYLKYTSAFYQVVNFFLTKSRVNYWLNINYILLVKFLRSFLWHINMNSFFSNEKKCCLVRHAPIRDACRSDVLKLLKDYQHECGLKWPVKVIRLLTF